MLLLTITRFTIPNRNADELYNYAYTNNISIINAAPYASGVLAKGTERSRLIAYSEATDQELEPVKAVGKNLSQIQCAITRRCTTIFTE